MPTEDQKRSNEEPYATGGVVRPVPVLADEAGSCRGVSFEWIVPADVDITPCPEGCGGLTEDPYGGPCSACWRRIDAISQRRWWEDE